MARITIQLEDDLIDEVRRRAARDETSVDEVLAQAVRDRFALERTLRPIREAFRQSGVTENDAADLYEAERKAMCDERRSPSG